MLDPCRARPARAHRHAGRAGLHRRRGAGRADVARRDRRPGRRRATGPLRIEPRWADGLDGIVFAPFLHAGFDHLIGNTIPFLLLGFAIALGGAARVAVVTVVVAVVGGLGHVAGRACEHGPHRRERDRLRLRRVPRRARRVQPQRRRSRSASSCSPSGARRCCAGWCRRTASRGRATCSARSAACSPRGCCTAAPRAPGPGSRRGRAVAHLMRAREFPIGAAATLAAARGRPAPGARAAARARAGVVGAGARRLARHPPRPRDAGDARPGDLHRRRPALLDRPGRRAEHAHARRRRAQAPPRAVRRAVPARRGARALHRAGGGGDRPADRRDRAGRRGRAAPRARRPARRRDRHARARPAGDGTAEVLGWYDAIVASVTEITAGRGPTEAGRRGFEALRAAMEPALDRAPETSLVAAAAASDAGGLGRDEVVSNAAVLLFGGIETTEGMIANAIAHLLAHPDQLAAVRADPALSRTRSRSRCGSSRPPRSSTATRRATPSWRARRSASASSSSSRSPARTATRPSSPIPTGSTCAVRTRSCTPRSRTGRTSASGCTSRGSRRRRRSRACSSGCPDCGSTAGRRPRAGSCSASPMRCGCCGCRGRPLRH